MNRYGDRGHFYLKPLKVGNQEVGTPLISKTKSEEVTDFNPCNKMRVKAKML